MAKNNVHRLGEALVVSFNLERTYQFHRPLL